MCVFPLFGLDQHLIPICIINSVLLAANSVQIIYCSLTLYTDPRLTSLVFSSYCCMLIIEAANTSYVVFGLPWCDIEPMIYHWQEKYTNHYTTEVLKLVCIALIILRNTWLNFMCDFHDFLKCKIYLPLSRWIACIIT
jgi:hypothetical protein